MRKTSLFASILLFSAIMAPASAETCSNQLVLTFHQYQTTVDTTLTVANPGSFDPGSMPTCPWLYTQPRDVTTGEFTGSITNVANDPGSLGTDAQGGFTFTPAPGYTGTVFFHTVSESGEFIQWESFITVAPGNGGGGGSTPTKAGCKKGGWKTATKSDGSTFKNEGDCVSYVMTGK